jgi:hypothetical protein
MIAATADAIEAFSTTDGSLSISQAKDGGGGRIRRHGQIRQRHDRRNSGWRRNESVNIRGGGGVVQNRLNPHGAGLGLANRAGRFSATGLADRQPGRNFLDYVLLKKRRHPSEHLSPPDDEQKMRIALIKHNIVTKS